MRFDDDGTTRFEPHPGGLDGALGRLFALVFVAQLEGRWPRLKICVNPSCSRLHELGGKLRALAARGGQAGQCLLVPAA